MKTFEAYTKAGWVPCTIRRKTHRKNTDRTVRAIYVQLLPARNIVKRWPEQVRPAKGTGIGRAA